MTSGYLAATLIMEAGIAGPEEGMVEEEESTSPVINIVGERVALGPMCHRFLPVVQRWNNDFAALRSLGDPPMPYTLEQQAAEHEALAAARDEARFLIYERERWRPIGLTRLHDIDHRNGTAEFVLFIGEADCRGKGYGTETTRLVLDYAFTALGLHNVMLTVYAFNLAAIRAYEKAGFRAFGRRRRAYWLDGQWWDAVYMDCLATEFSSPVLGRVFAPDQPYRS